MNVSTVDISGLVKLRMYFTRGAQWAACGAAIAAVSAFDPEIPDRWWGMPLAVLLALAWFALSQARVAAARVVVPILLVLLAYLIWRRWSIMSSPASDDDALMLTYLAMLLFVPIQGALGLLLPGPRAAARLPYARALFARPDPLGARLMRRLRGVRVLPVAVVLLMLLAVVGVVTMLHAQPREERQATRRAAQMLLAFLGGGALLWARRRAARRGVDVRRGDPRPPVLLLRSFGDDLLRLESGAKFTRSNDLLRRGMTFERIVASQLDRVGPVIAIGKPGESLAPLGAARDYVTDDVWQREVEQRMRDATLIVLMLGSSKGLAWELLRVHRLQLLRKLVLVFPPAKDLHQRLRTLRGREFVRAAQVLPDSVDTTRVLALVWDSTGHPLAIEGPRTEWAYETMIRAATLLVRSPDALT